MYRAADLVLPKDMLSAQIPIIEHSHCGWGHPKAWKRALTESDINLNVSQPTFSQNSHIHKEMTESQFLDLNWLGSKLRLDFKRFLSNITLKTTIHQPFALKDLSLKL